jgi:hypothetical protein
MEITQMLDLHQQRYPYWHDADLIVHNFELNLLMKILTICSKGKYWEFIKEDFEETILRYKANN